MDAFRASPPVSRTLAASVFIVSMLVVCNVISPHRLIFEWAAITKGFPEIWRFFTSFTLTSGFNILMLPYSIWHFGGGLERDSNRFDSASLLVYLLFVGSTILLLTVPGNEVDYPCIAILSSKLRKTVITSQNWDVRLVGNGRIEILLLVFMLAMVVSISLHLFMLQSSCFMKDYADKESKLLTNTIFGSIVFIDTLVLAIIWTFAQHNRGQIISYFGVNIPIQYFPFVILFATLITAGPEPAICQALAIPAAHLYEFLTHYWPTYGGGFNVLPTPAFLTNYFVGSTPTRTTQTKGYGTSIRTTEPANSAFSSGNSWGQRGAGRRLGSD